jgi:hypothetical protein
MGTLTSTRYYRVIVTSTLGVACSSTSNVITVLVNSIDPGVIGNNQMNCYDYNPDDLLNTSFSYCATPTTVEPITPSPEVQNTNTYTNGFRAFTFYGVAGCTYTFSTCGATSVDTYLRLYSGTTGSQVTFNDNACGLQSQIVWTCPTNGVYSVLLTRFSCASLTTNVFLKYSSSCTIPCAQTFCNSGNPDSLYFESPTSAPGAISYQWQSSTDNATWTDILGADTLVYDPTPITTTTYYRVLITSEINGVLCSTPTNVATSFVNNPSGGVIGSDQTICSGSAPSSFTVLNTASGLGSLTYQWESSIDNVNWTVIAGATATTYTSGSLTQTTYFRRMVTSTYNGLGCTAYSNTIVVTVNQLVAAVIASDQTICSGTTPSNLTITAIPSGSGVLTYQWQLSTNLITWTNISGATGTILTSAQMGSLTASRYYRLVVSSTLGGVSCSANSNTITITVNSVTAGTIASNQTICSGGSPAIFTSSSAGLGSGILSYQWQSSSNNISWSDISGATAATYTAPGPITNTTYYRRVRISALNGVICTANSNTLTVTVNQISAGVIGADQTICSGGTPADLTLSTLPSGQGTLTYQWQSSTNGTTWTNITGATGTTLSSAQMGSLTATRYYRLIVTSTISGLGCTEASNTVTITVNTLSAGVIGSNQTICSGSSPSTLVFTTSPSGAGTLTYQWQSAINGITWTNISGGNGPTLTSIQMGTLTSTRYYRVLVSSTLNSVECTGTSNTITVNVNSFTPGTIVSDQNICSGGDPAAFTNLSSPSGTGTFTYQWQSSTNGTTWTNIPLATSLTYNVSAGLTVSTYYRRLTSHTALGITCALPTNSVFVGVYSAGTVSSAQSICSGTQPSDLSVIGAIGNIQWQSSTNGSTWTNISGATSATLTSAQMGTLTASRYYRVTITGVSCTPSLVSNSILVTVLQLPNINGGPDQNICSGNSVVLAASGGLSYSWDNGVTNGVSFIPFSSLTYTVTGIGSNGCTNTDQVMVSVNPTPTVVIADNNPAIICQGQTFSLTSSVANVSSYQWRRNGVNISGANTSSFTGTLSGTYTLIVTSSQGCTATSNPIEITITPLPIVNAGPDLAICVGQSVTLNASGASNYSWSNGISDGVPFAPSSTITYTVSATSPTTGCVGTDQVTVTVNQPSESTIYTTSLGNYVLNGIEYSESGTYVQNTVNQFGCDSTITLNLTVVYASTYELETTNGIKIYPNPSINGKFFIEYPEEFNCDRLLILNKIGMIIKELPSISSEVDLYEVESGTYFIDFRCGDTRYISQIIKL